MKESSKTSRLEAIATAISIPVVFALGILVSPWIFPDRGSEDREAMIQCREEIAGCERDAFWLSRMNGAKPPSELLKPSTLMECRLQKLSCMEARELAKNTLLDRERRAKAAETDTDTDALLEIVKGVLSIAAAL